MNIKNRQADIISNNEQLNSAEWCPYEEYNSNTIAFSGSISCYAVVLTSL